MFSELKVYLPVEIVENPLKIPVGKGFAIGIEDYGPEWHAIWVVILNSSREIWWVPNPFVRAQDNLTVGRT